MVTRAKEIFKKADTIKYGDQIKETMKLFIPTAGKIYKSIENMHCGGMDNVQDPEILAIATKIYNNYNEFDEHENWYLGLEAAQKRVDDARAGKGSKKRKY